MDNVLGFTCCDAARAWVRSSDCSESGPWTQWTWKGFCKGAYLLRDDVDCPLSTDHIVWPTAFELSAELREKYSGGASLPWRHLSELVDFVEREALPSEAYWLVAITYAPGQDLSGTNWEDHLAGACSVAPFHPHFLGYDVSDEWLLSGLTNCMGNEVSLEDIKQQWGARLNAHHLFDELDAAEDYAGFIAGVVPSHSPFYVFGLWRLDNGR